MTTDRRLEKLETSLRRRGGRLILCQHGDGPVYERLHDGRLGREYSAAERAALSAAGVLVILVQYRIREVGA
ncbi:MAG: hypothetical protein ACKOC5_08660 [Chloroflexota bacterium]